ncbi:MAG TPA: aromatic ring-hydroxylating dioxygenase subunit alpha [Burkholderiaceae bacterium]|nr:aromatic ring-hydroxylating dioxygenase subunit alpha [Burkholderiaceae bacterium]
MIERSLWHPVASAPDLGEAPMAVHLLDEPLVLWRDAAGAVHAFVDRCPHRGARLSLGCVRGGELECPYHGWRFEGSGRAVAIPALPGFVPPPAHRVAAHAVREHCGLLWVRLDGTPAGDRSPPAFAAEQDPRLRKLTCGPYDVATSAPRLIENFLDMAHFAFVHEDWLGDRAHMAIDDYRIDATENGFLATGCKAWQPRSSVHAEGGAMVEYTYEVNAPYTAVLCKVPDAASVGIDGFRESIAMFVCPVSAESSRVWFRLAMNDFESPDETLQAFQDTIFGQDRPVLESQSPRRLPISGHAGAIELHSAADRSSAAYRRYLRECGIGFGVC